MQLPKINRLVLLLTFASLSIILTACSSGVSSGNEGDFVLDLYTGAGEVGGVLDDVLIRLADTLERQQEFKGKVKTALECGGV